MPTVLHTDTESVTSTGSFERVQLDEASVLLSLSTGAGARSGVATEDFPWEVEEPSPTSLKPVYVVEAPPEVPPEHDADIVPELEMSYEDAVRRGRALSARFTGRVVNPDDGDPIT